MEFFIFGLKVKSRQKVPFVMDRSQSSLLAAFVGIILSITTFLGFQYCVPAGGTGQSIFLPASRQFGPLDSNEDGLLVIFFFLEFHSIVYSSLFEAIGP